jgi:spore coat polysaccharide biosynthesis protein SpsF (cytidylyltransferase family)
MGNDAKKTLGIERNVVPIILARSDSKRLPNKCLQDFGGMPMLKFQYERIKGIPAINNVPWVLAPENDTAIAECCEKHRMYVYRGDYNPFLRIVEFIKMMEYKDDAIILQFTHDSPLLSEKLIETVIYKFIQDKRDFAFLSGFPKGQYFKIYTAGAFRKLAEQIKREHVAIWVRINEPYVWMEYGFRIRRYQCEYDFSDVNLEVNTEADLAFVRSIYNGDLQGD